MANIAILENALNDARVRAFLDTISYSEGTTANGYHTLFGGGYQADLSKHPQKTFWFTDKTGKRLPTSAAGRYQFLWTTWSTEIIPALGRRDFSPHTQDLAATYLLQITGALARLYANDFAGAVSAARRRWASFPGAGHNQSEQKLSTLQNYYNGALRVYSGGVAAPVQVAQNDDSFLDTGSGDGFVDNPTPISEDASGALEVAGGTGFFLIAITAFLFLRRIL